MSNPKFVGAFCVVAIVLGFGLYILNPTPEEHVKEEPEQVFCTQEAMQCPDGSYVGRTGPNCEFAVCPIPPGTVMEDGTQN